VGSGLEHEFPAGEWAGRGYGRGEQSYQYVEDSAALSSSNHSSVFLDFFNVPNNPAGSASMFVIHCKFPGDWFFPIKRLKCSSVYLGR
jgi:hypothetical protein